MLLLFLLHVIKCIIYIYTTFPSSETVIPRGQISRQWIGDCLFYQEANVRSFKALLVGAQRQRMQLINWVAQLDAVRDPVKCAVRMRNTGTLNLRGSIVLARDKKQVLWELGASILDVTPQEDSNQAVVTLSARFEISSKPLWVLPYPAVQG